ncbi:hypothetical protein LIER_23068 [Lithospermum erythrorhizon]|uniref:Aminotransferase-like plant mobile domain-containing protein n=1 Tax=Lithospermum erythrorhizon TaxID=34254 RepID=A0AAV3QXC7_LITER
MASFMVNGSRVSLAPPVLASIYRSLSHISLYDNPYVPPECFLAHYLFGWLGSYLHAQHIANSRPASPQMMRYHCKGRGKVYVLSEARTVLRSCPVTWKATRPDREQPFFYDDHLVQSPPDRDLFVSVRTGRICHMIGSEFIVDPYNPYRFSRQFVYVPTILGLSRSARQTEREGSSSWCSTFNVDFPIVWFSKRKRSSSSIVEDRDPKHARSVRKDISSFRGSRVASLVRRSPKKVIPDNGIRDKIVEVSSSVNRDENTELVDTGESPEFPAIEVAESCPLAFPTLTIAQGAKAILRRGAYSLWTFICDGLQGSLLRLY